MYQSLTLDIFRERLQRDVYPSPRAARSALCHMAPKHRVEAHRDINNYFKLAQNTTSPVEAIEELSSTTDSPEPSKIDWRGENPRLHNLYVRWAVRSLCIIDECIVRLSREAKTSLSGAINALYKEREAIIKEDAAYYEAHNILASVGLLRRVGLSELPELDQPIGKKQETPPIEGPLEKKPTPTPIDDYSWTMETVITALVEKPGVCLTASEIAAKVTALHPGRWAFRSITSVVNKMGRDGQLMRVFDSEEDAYKYSWPTNKKSKK